MQDAIILVVFFVCVCVFGKITQISTNLSHELRRGQFGNVYTTVRTLVGQSVKDTCFREKPPRHKIKLHESVLLKARTNEGI